MLGRVREWLTLALIALLPFHALLVTVFTKVIAGPGHAPLGVLALWKEGVLGLVLLIAAAEYVRTQRLWAMGYGQKKQTPQPTAHSPQPIDVFDLLIVFLLILSVAVTAFTHENWTLYLFGFRYDFVPLVAFMVLRRVSWSSAFFLRAIKTLLISGAIVALYAVISFVLPAEFFVWLGYSDLHSLYLPDKPVAAFQLIGETQLRRVQGPMSGPNHLGIWLLVPLACAVAWLRDSFKLQASSDKRRKSILIGVVAVSLLALLLSFSRAAWIAAFVLCCIGLLPVIRTLPRKVWVRGVVVLVAVLVLLASLFPSVIIRLSSSRGHLQGPIEALHSMISEPFGRGMGMAGPASNRVSDACVMLRESDDPSWAADRPDLCVFVGETQVQPVGRACSCPFLPENWFLQIGVEMGWLGFIAYLALIGFILTALHHKQHAHSSQPISHSLLLTAQSLQLSFLAVSIAGLFLHAFEDAAVSYTLWILAAAAIGSVYRLREPDPSSSVSSA